MSVLPMPELALGGLGFGGVAGCRGFEPVACAGSVSAAWTVFCRSAARVSSPSCVDCIPATSSLSPIGGEARGSRAAEDRACLEKGSLSLGVCDLRRAAPCSPMTFALMSAIAVALLGIGFSPDELDVPPFTTSLIPRLWLSSPLLLGFCDSAGLERGRRFGLKRARLAFVGDMNDARRLALDPPSCATGCIWVFSVVTTMEVEGDVFLRLAGVGSMVFWDDAVGPTCSTEGAYSDRKYRHMSYSYPSNIVRRRH